MTPLTAIVYTRQGCHLCDEAWATLIEHGLECRAIDIDQAPELRAKYDQCVPVVSIQGRVRFKGRVDRLLLKRIIAAES